MDILSYKKEGMVEGGSRIRKIWFWLPASLLLARWPWHLASFISYSHWWGLIAVHSKTGCHLVGPQRSTGSDVWTELGLRSFAGSKSWFRYLPRVDQGLTCTNELHKRFVYELNSSFTFLDNKGEWAGKRRASWLLHLCRHGKGGVKWKPCWVSVESFPFQQTIPITEDAVGFGPGAADALVTILTFL